MSERLDALPNAFYDFIVFITPSIQFAVGMLFGLGLVRPFIDFAINFNWGLINIIIVAGVVIVFGYEYGRIAETWSSFIVQRPLLFLAEKTTLLPNPDFNVNLDNEVAFLELGSFQRFRGGSKWTLYFYALLVAPRLGTDLLKRYAWEKLARSSAFTYAVLLLISLGWGLLYLLFGVPKPAASWSFGSVEFTLVVAILVFITYREYYQRNCWNNDLLTKTTPVLKQAEKLRETAQAIQITGDASIDLSRHSNPED